MGNERVSAAEDYNSHNTYRLSLDEMKQLLMKVRFIREDFGLEPRAKNREIRSE